MARLVPSPNCRTRKLSEFAYGGKSHRQPVAGASPADLGRCLFFRRNVARIQVGG
jgi:sarcosine oxidase delta subunit